MGVATQNVPGLPYQLLVDPIHVTWGDSEPERTFKVFHATFLAEHNEFSILVSGYGMDGE